MLIYHGKSYLTVMVHLKVLKRSAFVDVAIKQENQCSMFDSTHELPLTIYTLMLLYLYIYIYIYSTLEEIITTQHKMGGLLFFLVL